MYDIDTIKDIQRTLLCPESGVMDDNTIVHIKGLQYTMGIAATGRVDRQTAIQIQRLRDRYHIAE